MCSFIHRIINDVTGFKNVLRMKNIVPTESKHMFQIVNIEFNCSTLGEKLLSNINSIRVND